MDWILEHFHVDDFDGDFLVGYIVATLVDGAGVPFADGLISVVAVVLNEFLAILVQIGDGLLDATGSIEGCSGQNDLLLTLICELNLHAV